MNRLEKKISGMTVKQMIKFYEEFSGYKSERREIVRKEHVDGEATYFVAFEYTFINSNSIFIKGDSYVTKVEDVIPFKKYEEAERYLNMAKYPVTRRLSKNRCFLNLKENDLIKKSTGNYPEVTYDYGTNKTTFGIYGTDLYNQKEFSGFLYYLKKKHNYVFNTPTVVASFDINQLANIKDREELEKLANERNAVVVNEIKRTEEYLTYLKSLLK